MNNYCDLLITRINELLKVEYKNHKYLDTYIKKIDNLKSGAANDNDKDIQALKQIHNNYNNNNNQFQNSKILDLIKAIANTKYDALKKDNYKYKYNNECNNKSSLSKSQSAPQINSAPNCDSINSELVAANNSIEQWKNQVKIKNEEIKKLNEELTRNKTNYDTIKSNCLLLKNKQKEKLGEVEKAEIDMFCEEPQNGGSKSKRRTRRRRVKK